MEAAGKVDAEDTGRANCLTDTTGPTPACSHCRSGVPPSSRIGGLGGGARCLRWRRRAEEQQRKEGSDSRAPVRRVRKRRRTMLLQAAFLIATGFSRSALRRPCENAAYQELRSAALAVLANVEHDECVRHRSVLATPSMRGPPPLVTPAL